jgi:formate dehydrogenase iron-sulfur subunit
MSVAILTDVTKCIGCRECVAACKEVNDLALDVPRTWQKNDGLSAVNWTSILDRGDKHFVRKQCRHCIDPACVTACPVGALHKTDNGSVVYDSGKCLGCRYCMMACPYGIPRYDWDQPVPYVRKCTLCSERVGEGKEPGCTSACPVEATIFGEREQLLAEAHRRIAENPGKYIDRVWGEKEFGGTSVLYLSDIDLSFLVYGSGTGTTPLPQTTSAAMRAVPFVFVGMGGVMYGINWIIRRRMQLAGDREASED